MKTKAQEYCNTAPFMHHPFVKYWTLMFIPGVQRRKSETEADVTN